MRPGLDIRVLRLTDLCDRTDRILLEAKGSVERHRIREAIGQLFDYVRFLPFRAERLVVLVPERPAPDLVHLLDRLGIDLVYRDEDRFTTEAASGAASWDTLLPAIAPESAARSPVLDGGDAAVAENLIREPLQSLA